MCGRRWLWKNWEREERSAFNVHISRSKHSLRFHIQYVFLWPTRKWEKCFLHGCSAMQFYLLKTLRFAFLRSSFWLRLPVNTKGRRALSCTQSSAWNNRWNFCLHIFNGNFSRPDASKAITFKSKFRHLRNALLTHASHIATTIILSWEPLKFVVPQSAWSAGNRLWTAIAALCIQVFLHTHFIGIDWKFMTV